MSVYPWNRPRRLDVRKLKRYGHAFIRETWINVNRTPISRQEVAAAIEHGELNDEFCDPDQKHDYSRHWHIERIAFLVVHKDPTPIEVHANMRLMRLWKSYAISAWPSIVYDGNHRFAAAVYRKDKYILAICEGETKFLEKLKYVPGEA